MTALLFQPATARRLRLTVLAFAALVGLRIALGPYRALAGQPAALFRPVAPIRWLHIHHMPGVGTITILQVIGVAAAIAALAAPQWRRAGFATAWIVLLLLAGLRTSTGKLLHNDTLLLVATFPLLFAEPAGSADDQREAVRFGWPLSVGTAAVCLVYFMAGLAKLRHSGLAWATSDNMRYVMVEAARSGRPWFPALARGIARSPLLSHATAAGILGLELAFPVAFFVRRARPFFAAAAVALHVGTWLTLGIDYWLWAATALLLLGPPEAALRTRPPRPGPASAPRPRPDEPAPGPTRC